ncbi:MAG: hypothetical protein II610_02725 [Treponema sp.]|nr:hypothetical protein [Treponema sp.]
MILEKRQETLGKSKETASKNANEITQAPPLKPKGSLTLNSLKNARQTLARIIRKYNANEITSEQFKNLVYGINTLAHIFKIESDTAQDARIEAIEKAIAELEAAK